MGESEPVNSSVESISTLLKSTDQQSVVTGFHALNMLPHTVPLPDALKQLIVDFYLTSRWQQLDWMYAAAIARFPCKEFEPVFMGLMSRSVGPDCSVAWSVTSRLIEGVRFWLACEEEQEFCQTRLLPYVESLARSESHPVVVIAAKVILARLTDRHSAKWLDVADYIADYYAKLRNGTAPRIVSNLDRYLEEQLLSASEFSDLLGDLSNKGFDTSHMVYATINPLTHNPKLLERINKLREGTSKTTTDNPNGSGE